MANEYLTKKPTSGGNQKVWTISAWIKQNDATGSGGNGSFLFGYYEEGASPPPRGSIQINESGVDGRITVGWNPSGSSWYQTIANGSYRDTGNWYNLVVVVDTTKELISDGIQMYFNGVKRDPGGYLGSWGSGAAALNIDTGFNSKIEHYIGAFASNLQNSNLILSDMFFVDGQALTPDVFGFYKDGDGYMSSGTTQATDFRPGQWMPHSPTKIKKDVNRRGGFGVNGFYLPMNDSSNPGADFHCTPNSIIKLKGEDLPQPRNGASTTSDAFVSQVRKEIGGLGFAGCLKLDGNQGLSIADTAALDLGTGDFTIEGFYYFKPSTTGYPALFDGRGNGGDGVYPALFRDQNSDKLYYYVNSAVRIDNMPMRHNEWMHVAICRSSGTTRAFVDGVLVGSFSDTFNYICRDLYIGQSASNTNDIFGFVSNFRIVKGSAIYTANFTRPTAPLENVTNTLLLCANSSTSTTASTVTPSTISAIGSPIATTSELTGSISLAVAGAATGTGANLVTNGTFDTNTTGWTSEASATLSVDNGRLKVLTTNTSYGSANQTVTGLTVGQRYTFQTNMYYGNASLVTVLTGAVSVNSGWQSADFLWTYSFTAGSTSLLIDCQMASQSAVHGFWDNVILKAEDLPRDYSADIRGSGSNLTVTSQDEAGIAYNIPSNYGSVIDFNTNSERLYYNLDGTGRGTNDFTMECWFYPTREANTWGIIMQHATNGSWANGITINARYGNSRQFTIYSQNGSNNYITVDPDVGYAFNQWYHICAERYNDTLTLYVDGVAKANRDVSGHDYGTADTPSNSSQYAFSLAAQSDGSYPSDGYITDVRVYDGIAKYKGGFDVPKPYTPVGIEAFRTTADTCKNNFATLNPLGTGADLTYSNGNLTCLHGSSTTRGPSIATIGVSQAGTEKYYWEYMSTSTSTNNALSGIVGLGPDITDGKYAGYTNQYGIGYYSANGESYTAYGGSLTFASYGATYTNGDVIGVALDMETNNGTLTFYKNGVSQGVAATGLGVYLTNGSIQAWVPGFGDGGSSSNVTHHVNFGQNPTFSGQVTAGTNADDSGKGLFKYAPPTGFLALCEDNLPTPAIADPGKHFKTVLYDGDGSAGRSITGVGFKPDFVWFKSRNTAVSNILNDTVRGITEHLSSDSANAASTPSYPYLNSVNNDGFSLYGTSNSGGNTTGRNYVAWCWKAGGAALTNNDGSITSQVSVNRTAGFSIVSYTGNNTAGATIGHGLGKKPSFMIVKERTGASGWFVYHKDLGATKFLSLHANSAAGTETGNTACWYATEPNTSVFTVGQNGATNEASRPIIAYCWTEIEGYSKFGSYIGNNSADGPFAYCGFKPAWVLIKKTDGSGDENWRLFDSSRCPTNQNNKHLLPSSSNAESTESGIDLLSNGFKLRHADAHQNQSGSTYVFMAFAESPFQTANAK